MRSLLLAVVIAARAIARNRLRAVLTVLGILIGVAAVVTITALGAGARDSVGGQIQSIGRDCPRGPERGGGVAGDPCERPSRV